MHCQLLSCWHRKFPLLLAAGLLLRWQLLLLLRLFLLFLTQHCLVGYLSQLGDATRESLEILQTQQQQQSKLGILKKQVKHTFIILFFSSAERCLPAFSSLPMRS